MAPSAEYVLSPDDPSDELVRAYRTFAAAVVIRRAAWSPVDVVLCDHMVRNATELVLDAIGHSHLVYAIDGVLIWARYADDGEPAWLNVGADCCPIPVSVPNPRRHPYPHRERKGQ